MTAKNIRKDSIPGDVYLTPDWCVHQALEHIVPKLIDAPYPKLILDPGCGEGVFVKVCREVYGDYPEIHAFDVVPTCIPCPGATLSSKFDFLELGDVGLDADNWAHRNLSSECWLYDLIIGNPPYTYAQDFIDRALELGTNVVFLLRQGFLSSAKRASWWKKNNPYGVWILPNRPSFTNGQTDTADYCWVAWKRNYLGIPSLNWLPVVSSQIRKAKTPSGKCYYCGEFFSKYRCNKPDECDCPKCQNICLCKKE